MWNKPSQPYLCVNWTGNAPGGLPVTVGGPSLPIALFSPGPDYSLEIQFPTNLGFVAYNPTNGTVSRGDLCDFPR